MTVCTDAFGRMMRLAACTVFESNPVTSPATTVPAPSPSSANACVPWPPRAMAASNVSS